MTDDDQAQPETQLDAEIQDALDRLPSDLDPARAIGVIAAIAETYAPGPMEKLGLLLGAASLILLDRDDDETRH